MMEHDEAELLSIKRMAVTTFKTQPMGGGDFQNRKKLRSGRDLVGLCWILARISFANQDTGTSLAGARNHVIMSLHEVALCHSAM